jgi:hypothetical protein
MSTQCKFTKILFLYKYLYLRLYTCSSNNVRREIGIETLILVGAGIIYKMLYYKGNKWDNVADSRNLKTERSKKMEEEDAVYVLVKEMLDARLCVVWK